MTVILSILSETWNLVLASAAYLVAGFLLAGLIHVFLPADRLKKWLGGRNWKSVFNAAAIGVPLPLCSCSVVPVASELRKAGASKGATTAFLISTPESGIDSISVTWALLDPIMTIARPVAAFFTAFVGGIVQNFLDARDEPATAASRTEERTAGASCCSAKPAAATPTLAVAPAASCCSTRPSTVTAPPANEPARSCCSSESAERHPRSLPARVLEGLRYGAFDMFDDLAGFLAVGFLLAGALSVMLAAYEPMRDVVHSPWAPLIMLAAGVPMYVCASASTPMVAVLIREGLSPGAGLVFLLAGPATNAATIVVLQKVIGRRGVVVYVAAIAGCALLAGFAVNAIYASLNIAPKALTHVHEHQQGGGATAAASLVGAVILLTLITRGLWNRHFRKLLAPRPAVAAS
ncbi:putative permease [Phycisphaerae bacterium RAS1]|nr:putative permease [Phycisphaerae bacterium RAS1]